MAPMNEFDTAVHSTRRRTGIGFSARVRNMGLRNGWMRGVSSWNGFNHDLRK